MNYGFLEIIFVGVVALGLGIWQLWSINREISRDRQNKSAEPPRHPVGEHPLDDR